MMMKEHKKLALALIRLTLVAPASGFSVHLHHHILPEDLVSRECDREEELK